MVGLQEMGGGPRGTCWSQWGGTARAFWDEGLGSDPQGPPYLVSVGMLP